MNKSLYFMKVALSLCRSVAWVFISLRVLGVGIVAGMGDRAYFGYALRKGMVSAFACLLTVFKEGSE